MSDYLQPHGLQHTRLLCPPLSPKVCLTFMSIESVMLPSFLFAFNLFQHWGLFSISQLFSSGGQSTGASASASVIPMSIQDWFPLGWTDLISLQSKGLSRVFISTAIQKHQFFVAWPSLWSNSHICGWLLEKP